MNRSLTLTSADPQPKRILIVEDNVALRYTLGHWLRLLNYTVIEAATADEAVTLLESALAVDFVVTDVNMPGIMDGFDLARYINQAFPHISIIVVSGDDTHKQIKEESILFFKKPYDLEVISSHIIKLLGESTPENGSLE